MRDLVFIKLSTDRKKQCRISTKIFWEDGNYSVEKCAESDEALSHIRNIYDNYQKLSGKYAGKGIYTAKAEYSDSKVRIEYLTGERFEQYLDRCIDGQDVEAFRDAIKRYFETFFVDSEEFEESDSFREVFGSFGVPEFRGVPAVKDVDIDMIFANVLYDGEKWSVYDYEWTFDFLIPVDYIKYRFFWYYFNTAKRAEYKKYVIEDLGYDTEFETIYGMMETNFQRYVAGTAPSMNDIYNDIHGDVINMKRAVNSVCGKDLIQVFYDYGNGFDIYNMEYIKGFLNNDGMYEFSVPVSKGVKTLRLDPADEICAVRVKISNPEGGDIPFIHNGEDYGEYLLFMQSDPNIIIQDLEGISSVCVQLTSVLAGFSDGCNIFDDFVRDSKDKHVRELTYLNDDLRKRDCIIGQKDNIITQKDADIANLNAHIQGMYNSTSWKLTRPIRGAKAVIMGDRSIRDIIKSRKKGAPVTDYDKWIEINEKDNRSTKKLDYNPMFSVVIPVYNVADDMLVDCIESVLHQTYKNFQLILVDDHSSWDSVRKVLRKYQRKKKVKIIFRSENGHISKATNDGIEVATGDYIAFMDCDDVLSENALYEMAVKLNDNPDLDFIYSDEDKLSEDGKHRHSPFFKPDWSPDTFMSFMYTNHLGVYRTELVKKTGGLRTEFNGSQDYDFTLRFLELTDNSRVGHVPKVLYHWRERKESAAASSQAKPYALEAAKHAKEDALKRRGIDGRVEFVDEVFQYRVVYNCADKPKVSIVIPSKDNYEILKQCLVSIADCTDYDNYEIILVDNGSSDENRAKIEKLVDKYSIKYIYEKMQFNFSKMCNIGVSHATGEFILLLNDDIEIIQRNWLDILVGQASLPHVGAVGVKLYYPESDLIQHVGVINIVNGPTHCFSHMSDSDFYYFNRNRLEYNYLAVTGACLMVKKDKYQEVGNMDEKLSVTYNDVDLCINLYEKGYYNVLRNDVVLYHHESVSRGNDAISPEKMKRLVSEREYMYGKHPKIVKTDPFYNINLAQNKDDFSINTDFVDFSEYNEIKKNRVRKSKGEIQYHFDEISAPENAPVRISGWAVSNLKWEQRIDSYLIFDNGYDSCIKAGMNRISRPDVRASKGSHTDKVGFNVTLPGEIFDRSKDYRISIMSKYPLGLKKKMQHTDMVVPAVREKVEFEKKYVFSILVPLYNTPMNFLKEMIDSVLAQTYAGWELCLADGSDSSHPEVGEFCRKLAAEDSRIRYKKLEKNGGISENTNACIELAGGDFIALFDHDDLLHEDALYEAMLALESEPDIDVIYTDEDKVDEYSSVYSDAHIKSDYNIDLLRTNNYICHFFIVKKCIVDKVGGFNSEYNGSQDYDFILRCTEQAKNIHHIPKVLYHWRMHSASTAMNPESKMYCYDAAVRALDAHLERTGIDAKASMTDHIGFYRVNYPVVKQSRVSVLLLDNGDGKPDIAEEALNVGILYHNYEVIRVDCKRNFADAIVGAVNQSSGDYILLLDSNLRVVSENWIRVILSNCQRSEVGIVGCKFYDSAGKIAHCGLTIDGGSIKSLFEGHPAEDPCFFGRGIVQQDLVGVSFRCAMFEKELFAKFVNDRLDVSSEVMWLDFCFWVRRNNNLIVFTPDVKLKELNSSSFVSGWDIRSSDRDIRLLLEKWNKFLKIGDVYCRFPR